MPSLPLLEPRQRTKPLNPRPKGPPSVLGAVSSFGILLLLRHLTIMSEDFYKKLPSHKHFLDTVNFSKYTPVPDDWYIVISDVKDSTKAIADGRYKEINAIGAASIVTILNTAKKTEIPYVFGGDGATILIPPSLVRDVKRSLVSARDLAKKSFGLDLRVGIVPILDIIGKHNLSVLKFQASATYSQAMLCGDGVSAAETLIKNKETSSRYEIPESVTGEGDFNGFECRWEDIPSPHGETVNILVKALSDNDAERSAIYRNVLEKIDLIYGSSEQHHPVAEDNLNLTIMPSKIKTETAIRNIGKGFLIQFLYIVKIALFNLYGRYLMRSQKTLNDYNLSAYKKLLVATSDYRKFDDALRMVIAGTEEMSKELLSLLTKLHSEKKIVYGFFVTDRALVTCLVFERYGKQVHFIDGADGGYTMAARGFKEQLKAISEVKPTTI